MNTYRKLALAVLSALALNHVHAQTPVPDSQKPLLIVGASFAEAKTPFNNGIAPLGGISAGLGSYLSLGNALIRHKKLPGYVINEAQAGGGTFARLACAPGEATCGPAGWDSYQTQLERAIARVAIPPARTQLNAKYVVIIKSNDCNHADAFGVPQTQTVPCTMADMNASIDRMIAVGQYAVSRGLTPIFDKLPKYEDLDLPAFRARNNLAWVISEGDYNLFRDLYNTRIGAALPQAIVLDLWGDFQHGGDGLHPNDATNERAADLIARTLVKLDKRK